jgi:hypothetical protein
MIDKFDVNKFLDTDKVNELLSTDYSENELCEYVLNDLKSQLKGEER